MPRTAVPLFSLPVATRSQSALVASFNRPGGNAIGVSIFAYSTVTKRFQLLREMISGPDPIGVLMTPDGLSSQLELKELQQIGTPLGEESQI
jgi:putative tryptophan/tyrosine transport system substrate-binding protein